MPRFSVSVLSIIAGWLALCSTTSVDGADEYLAEARKHCDALLSEWRQAHGAEARKQLGDALWDAAVRAERPEIVEQVAAAGQLAEKEIHVSHHAHRVRLQELRTFKGIRTTLDKEDGYFDFASRQGNSLVRRITSDAFEVWTPRHGWLLDRQGRLLNEAHPPRRDGHGREWFGAFLPDGRWVTTDLWEMDCKLTFFSREGSPLKEISSAELAPPGPEDARRELIGWARSDKDGAAWIVNIGSEQGYATVRVGPNGPARVLAGNERWQLCYPRALGPRGWFIEMSVPDDTGRWLFTREEAGHGMYVGYPGYDLVEGAEYSPRTLHQRSSDGRILPPMLNELVIPDGNFDFGFWPGQTDVFIGSETLEKTGAPGAIHIVKQNRHEHVNDAGDGLTEDPRPVVDKTWFYTRAGRFQGWVRARRLGDSADGHDMLFRLNDDGRIATLNPKLGVSDVRRFVWPTGKRADAVELFDDLRLGLFVRSRRLVLAAW